MPWHRAIIFTLNLNNKHVRSIFQTAHKMIFRRFQAEYNKKLWFGFNWMCRAHTYVEKKKRKNNNHNHLRSQQLKRIHSHGISFFFSIFNLNSNFVYHTNSFLGMHKLHHFFLTFSCDSEKLIAHTHLSSHECDVWRDAHTAKHQFKNSHNANCVMWRGIEFFFFVANERNY